MKKYPFLFCGFTGLCLEILWTGLHSLLRGDASMKGTTSLLMFPIYGCASLILPVYKKLKSLPALLRGSLYTLPDFTWQNLPAVLSCRLFTCAPGTIPECPISTKESSVWTISRSGFSQDCFSKKYLQNLLEKSFQVVYDRSKRFCVTTHRRTFLKEFS